jgi:hypothetical protein
MEGHVVRPKSKRDKIVVTLSTPRGRVSVGIAYSNRPSFGSSIRRLGARLNRECSVHTRSIHHAISCTPSSNSGRTSSLLFTPRLPSFARFDSIMHPSFIVSPLCETIRRVFFGYRFDCITKVGLRGFWDSRAHIHQVWIQIFPQVVEFPSDFRLPPRRSLPHVPLTFARNLNLQLHTHPSESSIVETTTGGHVGLFGRASV